MKILQFSLGILVLLSCSEPSIDKQFGWKNITESNDSDPIQVEIFGEQFKWSVRYSGDDNTLGKFDYKLTSEINPLAIMTAASIDASLLDLEYGSEGLKSLEAKLNELAEIQTPKYYEEIKSEIQKLEKFRLLLGQMKKIHDPKIDIAALDDIILTDTLVLCEDEEYEFNFRSKDVLHAAYFPHFRAQMNTVPGTTTRFNYTPLITTKKMRSKVKNPQFEYMLMCNKICGAGHYKMKMVVRVITKKEYDSWMTSKSSVSFKKTNDAMKQKIKHLSNVRASGMTIDL